MVSGEKSGMTSMSPFNETHVWLSRVILRLFKFKTEGKQYTENLIAKFTAKLSSKFSLISESGS